MIKPRHRNDVGAYVVFDLDMSQHEVRVNATMHYYNDTMSSYSLRAYDVKELYEDHDYENFTHFFYRRISS